MPRIRDARPTNIYWLVDVRPETLTGGWSGGKPFYCGKTVSSPRQRFSAHKCEARNKPTRLISAAIIECMGHIHIETMAVVPAHGDWEEAERRWIRQIRLNNPDAVNVSDGGTGTPGAVHSDETCTKRSESMRRLWKERPEAYQTPERLASERDPKNTVNARAAKASKPCSDETREKLRFSRLNASSDLKQKIAEGNRDRAKPHTDEAKEKIRQKAVGRVATPETRAILSAAHKKRWETFVPEPVTEETRARMRASSRARWDRVAAEAAAVLTAACSPL